MVKTLKVIVFFLAIGIITSCGLSGFHTVYSDLDHEVYDQNRVKCERVYSTFDGKSWTDYYGAPCLVFLKRQVRLLK